MKKYVLKTICDYSLIHLPDNKCTPYCVAWMYDSISECWCQGHYFSDYKQAVEYFKKCVKINVSIDLESM